VTQESIPKPHRSLSPRTNLLLIIAYAIAVVFGFLILQPRLPLTLGFVGALLGMVAGLMQHFSIMQSPEKFRSAVSLMGVRRALTSTPWGRKYIAWLYFSKATLVLTTFLLIREPLLRVVLSFLAGYWTLMLLRECVSFRAVIALHRSVS
jgi:hypothetical protein